MTSEETKKRLSRILAMVPLASAPKGADVAELCRYLGCATDDLVRDVEALIMCGVHPYTPSDYAQAYVEDGRLHISFPASFRRPVRVSAEEHAALQCALLQVVRAVGPAEARVAKSLMGKFAYTHGKKGLREKDVVDCSVQVKIPESKRVVLQKAIEDGKKLLMEYYSLRSGEVTERVVRPYALIARSRHWYLIAHDEKRGKAVPFRGDRIRRASTTAHSFQPPADFDAAKYLDGRMFFDAEPAMEVRVRFGPEYARFIAERFPPESLKRQKDGGAELALQTDSLKWAARWVMKQGPYATARAPAALRDEIVRTCDEILALYGPGGA
jgi:proteasome accessory factor C